MTLKRPRWNEGKVVVLEHVSKLLKDNPLGDPHVRKVASLAFAAAFGPIQVSTPRIQAARAPFHALRIARNPQWHDVRNVAVHESKRKSLSRSLGVAAPMPPTTGKSFMRLNPIQTDSESLRSYGLPCGFELGRHEGTA